MKKCLDCDTDLGKCGNAKKRCNSCQKEYRKLCWRIREKDPKRKEDNKRRIQKFRNNNPEKIKEYAKKANNKYRNGINRNNHLIKKREQNKKYYYGSIEYKLGQILRSKLWRSLKNQKADKDDSALELIGCSKIELVNYLESHFKEGMSWENWTLHGWHIDHIRPISSFDLSDPSQIKQCFHYSNLQPLWAIDNLKKSDSWEPDPKDA